MTIRRMFRHASCLAVAAVTALLLIPGTAQAVGSPQAAGSATHAGAVDAYAAAKSQGTIGIQSSFYSGTIGAGDTHTFFWNNANPLDDVYEVGFSPVGASTSTPCLFETVRSWYVKQFSGEREFWFSIRNIGLIDCGADILVTHFASFFTSSQGAVDPGASVTRHWNNANPLTASYVVGFNLSGATSGSTCQFEATRTWYQQQPGGEREFWYTIKNVGAIACSPGIILGSRASTLTSSTGTLAPGNSVTKHWNNAGLTSVYVVGASPQGASATTACQFEVSRTWYRQVINPPAEREFYYTLRNVGTISCAADILLASIAA